MSAAFNPIDCKFPKMRKLGCSEEVCRLIVEGSMLGPRIFLIQIIEVSIVMDIVREILEEE